MIPKTIHLCWFSGDKYPEKIKRCINSWKKILPDYTIKIWDKEKALAIGIDFIDEAISVNKWAFAADVVRAYALYTEGGIYMDSDIYIKKRFDDFLTNEVILFQEFHAEIFEKAKSYNSIDKDGKRLSGKSVEGLGIQAAFLMANKGHLFFKKIVDFYKNHHFIKADGSYFMETIAPSIYAKELEAFDYKYIDKNQILSNNISVYESKYIAGKPSYTNRESIAIHCCTHSWYDYSLYGKIKMHLANIIHKISFSSRYNIK